MDSSTAMKVAIFVAISHCFITSDGFKFNVGGRDGWILHPSEDYSNWAHRNRFVVNDTLYFKYNKGKDSVLEVTKDAYYNCNTSNPLLKMENGSSEFNLTRSGPFFFISGVKDHCEKGQKLLLIVISQHHRYSLSPAVSPSPAPESSPPTVSPAPTESPASSPAQQSATAPEPSSSAPAVATPPPEIPAAESPPAPAPGAPQKAAASAMSSVLTVSLGLIVGSSLFLGVM